MYDPKESPVSQSVEGWEEFPTPHMELKSKYKDVLGNFERWNQETMHTIQYSTSFLRWFDSFIRNLQSSTLTTLVKEMEGLKVSPPYPNASNGYSREVSDTEKEFNAGISAAVEVVKKMV